MFCQTRKECRSRFDPPFLHQSQEFLSAGLGSRYADEQNKLNEANFKAQLDAYNRKLQGYQAQIGVKQAEARQKLGILQFESEAEKEKLSTAKGLQKAQLDAVNNLTEKVSLEKVKAGSAEEKALVAGDMVAGEVVLIEYDGTRFQLLNPNSYTNLVVSGTLTYGGVTLTNAVTGTGKMVLDTSPAIATPTLNNPTVTNYVESVVAIGTVTTTNTLSLTNGTVQTATLTASTACTFTMPTATAGKSFVLLLKQAASTGNGTATFTGVKWGTSGAPTITATAGKMDILTFIADGTNWYGNIAQGYTP